MSYFYFLVTLVLLCAAIYYYRKKSKSDAFTASETTVDGFIAAVANRVKYSDEQIEKLMPLIRVRSIEEVRKVHDAIIEHRHRLLGTFQSLDRNRIY